MLDYEEIAAVKAKQLASGSRVSVRIDDDEVLYRGRVIRRHDNAPNGYGGRYSVKARHPDGRPYVENFSRMLDAKIYIDKSLA